SQRFVLRSAFFAEIYHQSDEDVCRGHATGRPQRARRTCLTRVLAVCLAQQGVTRFGLWLNQTPDIVILAWINVIFGGGARWASHPAGADFVGETASYGP